MATSIRPSIPVLSPSFLYHPYIPSFKSKDFSFTGIIYIPVTLPVVTDLQCTCIYMYVHSNAYVNWKFTVGWTASDRNKV